MLRDDVGPRTEVGGFALAVVPSSSPGLEMFKFPRDAQGLVTPRTLLNAASRTSMLSIPRMCDTSASMAISEFTLDDSENDDFSIAGASPPLSHSRGGKARYDCDEDNEGSEFTLDEVPQSHGSPEKLFLLTPALPPPLSGHPRPNNATPPLTASLAAVAPHPPPGLPSFARPLQASPRETDSIASPRAVAISFRSGVSVDSLPRIEGTRRPSNANEDPLELDEDGDPKTLRALASIPSPGVSSPPQSLPEPPLPSISRGWSRRLSTTSSNNSSNATAAHGITDNHARGSTRGSDSLGTEKRPIAMSSSRSLPRAAAPGMPPRAPSKRAQ
jgi:hypothetical protein